MHALLALGRSGLVEPRRAGRMPAQPALLVQCGVGGALTALVAGTPPLLLIGAATAALWTWDRLRQRAVGIGAWLRHLLAMCVAMYLGMDVYMAIVWPRLVAAVGPTFVGAPSYCGMVVSMLVPMVALMRFEGHGWRMCADMSLAMVTPIVVCFTLVGLGIARGVPLLAWLTPASVYGIAHDAMLLGMIALMVARRRTYATCDSQGCEHPGVMPRAAARAR